VIVPEPPELQDSCVARAAALFAHLSELGVSHAVLSPGSRSTSLVLGLAATELPWTVVPEERAAAFFALGRAKTTGQPVVVITTSGTAAIELLPAVAEASAAGVPLIIVTADRPRRLQGVGSPQTVDQVGPFAPLVRHQVALDLDTGLAPSDLGSLAVELVRAAMGGRGARGPVQLNAGFAEALPSPIPFAPPATSLKARTPRVMTAPRAPLAPDAAAALLDPERQGWLVVGGEVEDPVGIAALGAALGWPVIADAQARVPAGDAVLTHGELLPRARIPHPDIVVVIGQFPLGHDLLGVCRGVARTGGELVAWSPDGIFRDPLRLATGFVEAPVAPTVAERLAALGEATRPVRLADLDVAAEGAIAVETVSDPMGEVAATRALLESLEGDDLLFVSASLPIRYVDWFRPPLASPPEVHANRGVNGIDGVIASFLGAASARDRFGVLVIGDVAARYDLGALLALPRPRAGLILVLENGGGLIFDTVSAAARIPSELQTEAFVAPPPEPIAPLLRGLGLPTVEFEFAHEVPGLVGRARAGELVVAVHRSSREAERNRLARLLLAVDEALGRIVTWP